MQDEFEPWPHRLVVQTNDSGADIGDLLPASIGALLLQKKTLSSSGLQILEFEGMDSLRVVARKIIRDLGYGCANKPKQLHCTHAIPLVLTLFFIPLMSSSGPSSSSWFRTIQLMLHGALPL